MSLFRVGNAGTADVADVAVIGRKKKVYDDGNPRASLSLCYERTGRRRRLHSFALCVHNETYVAKVELARASRLGIRSWGSQPDLRQASSDLGLLICSAFPSCSKFSTDLIWLSMDVGFRPVRARSWPDHDAPMFRL